ncbi:MAG: RidA family protein [Hyphomonadaceae bacterium]|nr:RidA family protein [Hyphomonadaceae bacterium]
MTRRASALPPPSAPRGHYDLVVVHGGLAYVSGHLPRNGEDILHPGKVGGSCTFANAQEAARASALACLSSLEKKLGTLDAIERVLKVTGYVASASGFNMQTEIVNAASQVIVEQLGPERGAHARSAVGVAELPRDASVEIEMICALAPWRT